MKILETQALTKHFGGLAAVQSVDICIKKGEILSLIGPNGAGKSTMFHLLTGFIKPTSGKVFFQGEEITELETYLIADKGIVTAFQKTQVFKRVTVLECAIIGCHIRRNTNFFDILLNNQKKKIEDKKVEEKALQLLDFTGLSEVAYRPAERLSYGQQRLLEIAVALAAEPALILMDEPMSGMNPEESNRVVELVRKIKRQGITVGLVEHNMKAVMAVSDRVVVLNYGRKIAEDIPEVVRKNPEVIKAYLGEGYQC